VVLTHGFILDEKGEEKMSKSKGNTLSPQELMKTSGADILRLWVASSDYSSDIRFGPAILQGTAESYRKLRNTLRWMLGMLAHYDGKETVAPEDLPELERLMLHRLAELDGIIREAYAEYDYKRVVAVLSQFMNTDLSAFYVDIRKDALYCEPTRARSGWRRWRRSSRSSAAPACGWRRSCASPPRRPGSRAMPSEDGSVHLQLFPQGRRRPGATRRWPRSGRDQARAPRRHRRAGDRAGRQEIGSSLEAAPQVFIAEKDLMAALDGVDLAEVCITSGIEVVAGCAARGRLHARGRGRRRRGAEAGGGNQVRALLAHHQGRGQRSGVPGAVGARRRGRARVRCAGGLKN
jgi:isoleucyl-tRNA synthetase